MNTSKRFEQAINKLYIAFHEDTLIPECCNHCAVGNICDNHDSWKHLTVAHGSLQLSYVGLVNQNFGRRFNGYQPVELLHIEAAFLKGCGYSLPLHYKGTKPLHPTSKETLFNGLCATVEMLCTLDGIPNIMDCSQLFQFERKSEMSFSA